MELLWNAYGSTIVLLWYLYGIIMMLFRTFDIRFLTFNIRFLIVHEGFLTTINGYLTHNRGLSSCGNESLLFDKGCPIFLKTTTVGQRASYLQQLNIEISQYYESTISALLCTRIV